MSITWLIGGLGGLAGIVVVAIAYLARRSHIEKTSRR
jgi:hypothetical protein